MQSCSRRVRVADQGWEVLGEEFVREAPRS